MGKLLMDKELRTLVQELTQLGYVVERADGGHWKVYRNSRYVYSLPSTPGRGRWRQNLLAEIKRRGLDEGAQDGGACAG